MLSFLIGVFYSTFFGYNLFLALLFFAILFIFIFSFYERKHIIFAIVIFSIFNIGVFWYQKSLPEKTLLIEFIGKEIEINGIIFRDPEFKDANQKIIIRTENGELILLNIQRYPEYKYGDMIFVRGKLKEPENFNGFDYKNYLAKDDIYFLMQNPSIEFNGEEGGLVLKASLFKLKKSFENNIKLLLPSPESNLINGILFGSKAEIPKDLYDNFIKTGTAHIVALSGFNVTIIVIFLAWIFGFFVSSRKVVVLIAIFIIALFVIMTGASSSVVRAALMGSVLLLARYYGRAKYSLNALVFAAVLMVLFNPKVLVFDISFQLSFLATLGLLYIYPYFLNKFKNVTNFFKLRETISATLAVEVMVLPILVYNFNQISVIAPVVNVLILPLIPIAMLLGFLAGLLGFISLSIAKIFILPLWLVLAYQIKIIEFFGSLSFSSINFLPL